MDDRQAQSAPPPPPPPPRRPRPRDGRGRRWSSLRLGTLAGIDVRVHISFFILVWLVALGSTAPGGPGLVPGLAWLVALFGCVVVHELAHSLVATRHGIPVVEIELLPIGGVSKMARPPDDPHLELRISAAGPLASLALAAVFAVLALLAGVVLWPPTLYGGGFLARLAWVNLLLGGFNLLPAFPLDGGRVLRAWLEERMAPERATHLAAQAGRLFAVVMVTAGVFLNIWLVLIGVFVWFGSWAEEAATIVHARVKDLRVGDVMIREPVVLPADAPAGQVAEQLWHGAQREFPVVTPTGAYLGLVTADALLRARPDQEVGSLADRNVVALDQNLPLEASGLLDHPGRVAAVVASGRVVGLVRAADVALVVDRLVRHGPAS